MTKARVLALLALMLSTSGAGTGAQLRGGDGSIIGTWTSTLNDIERDKRPPLKIAETVTLTIAASGNVQLDRTTRALNARGTDHWVGNGVYSVPTPGILRLTFNPNLQVSAVVWRYRLNGDSFTITDDDTNVSRTFHRATPSY